MSDETPAAPGPSAEEPITANPVEQPTADTPAIPAAPAAAGATPSEPETPTEAGAPAAAASDVAEAPTESAEAPTEAAPVPAASSPGAGSEAPTEVAPVPPADAPVAAPVAPAAAAATTERRRGVFVPAWAAVVLGVLVVAGLGFLIGWIAAPSDDSSPSNAAATAPVFPGNGQNVPTFPNGNGSTGGNGSGNGSTNGNGNDSDNGSDSRPTVPTQSRAYLGVSLAPGSGDGATIGSVQDGSPAAKAGLKAGDVITEVDGDTVSSPLDAVQAIREHDAGDSVTITYTRNGSSNTAKVTLAETPSESAS